MTSYVLRVKYIDLLYFPHNQILFKRFPILIRYIQLLYKCHGERVFVCGRLNSTERFEPRLRSWIDD